MLRTSPTGQFVHLLIGCKLTSANCCVSAGFIKIVYHPAVLAALDKVETALGRWNLKVGVLSRGWTICSSHRTQVYGAYHHLKLFGVTHATREKMCKNMQPFVSCNVCF